jgi:hypothetical protein
VNEREKQGQNPGKGHNELLEIANPMEQTKIATEAVQLQAPENRGTHVRHVILASARELAEKSITATNPTQKATSSQFA